jgi:ubiquinone/menaquinone biosynthesis C-methylase UbiE
MRRVVVPELLDTDAGTPQQIADSLADLRWLNRNFGGISTTTVLLRRIAQRSGRKRLTLLDVAGASGDVAAGAREQLASAGIILEVTVLDRASSHLAPGSASVVGDAFQLPFHDAAFDVVASALFLHHLEPEQIQAFLREALRVSRDAVVINDLRRGYFHLAAAFAARLLYRSSITAHDSVASVRRAYTKAEMTAMISHLGTTFELTDHYFCRLGAILWKQTSS